MRDTRSTCSLAAGGLLLAAALSSTASAQAELTRTGGVLGTSLTYTVEGAAFDLFALLPSTTPGPTPLAILDPLDPRLLGVGLDLLGSALVVGGLGPTGTAVVAFPLPADPTLSGVPIYAQAVTLPGVATLVDEVSNATGVVLGLPGDAHLSLGSLPVETAGFTSIGLDDGRVLLGAGGELDPLGNTVPSASLRVFDPQTQGYATLPASLTYASIAPAGVKLADGRVLYCGGLGAANSVLAGTSIYDPVSGTASAAPNMGTPRTQHTATLLADGRVLVTGGIKAVNASDPISSLGDILGSSEVYDPVANTWSGAAGLPLPRVGHSASLLPSGRVLITGGLEVGSLFGIPLPSIVSSCRRYDPVADSMLGTASFSGARALHGQLTLADGRVLVAGGADGDVLTQNFSSIASCRVYNEATNTWTNVGSLPEVRTYPNLVQAGGRVHALSGLGTIDVLTLSGTPVKAIASADPVSFSWASSGTMVYARPLSASVAIDGGERIVVLGPGDSGSPAFDGTADIYLP